MSLVKTIEGTFGNAEHDLVSVEWELRLMGTVVASGGPTYTPDADGQVVTLRNLEPPEEADTLWVKVTGLQYVGPLTIRVFNQDDRNIGTLTFQNDPGGRYGISEEKIATLGGSPRGNLFLPVALVALLGGAFILSRRRR